MYAYSIELDVHHEALNTNAPPTPKTRRTKLPMMMEKQRLAKELGTTPEAVGDYMRRWRNAEREAKALHKFTDVRTVSSVCAPLH